MKKKTTPSLRSFESRCEPDYKVSVGMREEEGDGMSDSSSLDKQIAYSCVEARVFDCVCDRGMGKEELCDSENSILEKVAEKLMDRGFPSENRGSREGTPDSELNFVYAFCNLRVTGPTIPSPIVHPSTLRT
ncbi:hypothetical protein SASPL_147240 [Salvia splendens]|uniref:Uncharacterized protein n=1 Tax=Salvia splendens TaxID=180675 RepID=A0A8X8WE38_SALSN|nr:hypothetical protein SASPL_147240 [Salvia splendens]